MNDFELELDELSEFEFEDEDEFDDDEFETDYEWDLEGNEFGDSEYEAFEFDREGIEPGGPLLEDSEVTELALELLEIDSDEELEQFLGKIFKQVSRGAGKFFRSGVGRSLLGTLRGVAKTALPVLGGALGTIALPGIGTVGGAGLGNALASLFEAEMENELDSEQGKLKAAKRFVKVSEKAAIEALRKQDSAPSKTVAKMAVKKAVQSEMQGFVRRRPRPRRGGRTNQGRGGRPNQGRGGRPNQGRWVRMRGHIVMINAG